MPATRPTNADPKPKHNDDANVIDQSGTPFSVHFDKLVIAVGAYSQSDYLTSFSFSIAESLAAAFDVPGVKEHAHFLKDVKDARRIRSRILECP
jgi:NADH dehydrogenase FAD-containing subunit